SLTTLGIGDTSSSFDIVDLQSKLDSMSNLETVILKNIGLTSIPDLSSSKDSLTSFILSNNGEIPSVYPLAAQGLSQLLTFNCNDCSISDLSPMYSLPNLMTISVVGNNICMGSESTEDLGSKFHNYGEAGFILDLGSDLATDQTCDSTGCSSIAYTSDSSCTPITDNIVCSETKPGSTAWYVVCASDSYTSYTSAEDFSCISPGNDDGTFGCSGGCEYGQECRYDSTSTSTSCQQVIVDDILHDVIYSLFGGSDLHCDTTDQTFSVASLKTLISAEDEDGNVSPEINTNYLEDLVSSFSGIEHVGFITKMQFYHLYISETKDLEPLSTLSNLNYLFLSDSTLVDMVDPFDLPDFTGLSSLETLFLQNMPLTLPSDRYVLPSTIKELRIVRTPTAQAGFDKNVGYNYLSSLEYLQFGGEDNLITSIESLSEDQLAIITGFQFANYPIYDGFNTVISEMTNLESLYLRNCNLQNIPDLSKSSSTLTDLNFNLNHDITSLVPLSKMGLFSLINLSLRSCSISDLSPLYDFPNLINVSIKNNKICLGTNSIADFIAKFTQSSVSIELGTQNCECFSDITEIGYSDTPITDNIVCSETLPGSGSWHYVCSSHSIASYTSVDTFECLAPLNADGVTYGCSGGCEYGYECRYDELTQSTSSCYLVIIDENLHAYVADMFVDSDETPNYDHRTDSTPSLFSVASLRTLSASTLSNDGFSLSNSDRFALLDGIEHIRSLTSISLPYHNFVSADPLGSLHGLESLSLAHNMYGAPEDADGNVIEGFSDLSFICSLHSLSTLALSSVTSVSALPDTSECADTYTSLSSLNLAETSIIDISALLVAADSTNVSLTELIMNGVSLYDDIVETTSLFDPSILESFSSISSLGLASLGLVDSDLLSIVHLALDELNVAHNSLVDISPLYHLNGDLATLDISYNSIC
ncbi:hypothetical protein ADUPG1_010142, partial [Aduncisulcus paluster]